MPDDNTPETCWYRDGSGWRRAPAPWGGASSWEKQLEAARFFLSFNYGPDTASLSVTVHEHHDTPERWLVLLDTPCHYHPVVVEGLPAFLATMEEFGRLAERAMRLDDKTEAAEREMREARRRNGRAAGTAGR
jgi:hypothetical protein